MEDECVICLRLSYDNGKWVLYEITENEEENPKYVFHQKKPALDLSVRIAEMKGVTFIIEGKHGVTLNAIDFD